MENLELFYPFFITFCLVFFSELGDKTQLFVLSFCAKNKTKNVLLGVAIGTFFSHGFAILFGSKISYFCDDRFQFYCKLFTYFSFLLFGIIGFFPKKEKNSSSTSYQNHFLQRLSSLKLNCIIMVAFCILIGELGDKTFLASLSLGFEYPNAKFPLILGSICGMVASNFIAIFCSKLIGKHVNIKYIEFLSNFTFIVLGLLGLICLWL